MRSRVHQIGIENHGSPIGRLTVSVGVCSVVPIAGLTREGLVDAADTALYRAKAGGRNRAELADPMLPAKPETDRLPSKIRPQLIEE